MLYIFNTSDSSPSDFTCDILFSLSQQTSRMGLGILNALQVTPMCSEARGLLLWAFSSVGQKLSVNRGGQMELGMAGTPLVGTGSASGAEIQLLWCVISFGEHHVWGALPAFRSSL